MSRSRRIREQTDAAVQRLDATPGTSRNQPDLERYRDDPVAFVREVLKGKSKTRRSDGSPYQFEFLQSVADHDQVAIRTSHGTGKTVTLAWLALWWLATRPEGLVIALAPTGERQGQGLLLREVKRFARQGKVALKHAGFLTEHRANGSRLVVLSGAADVGNIEGQHAPSVLLLADEAKSLERATMDAVVGALTTAEAKRVFASTPGEAIGPFHDAATDESGRWATHHIAAQDSSAVTEKWCSDRAAEWGVTSPAYRMRVLGEFVTEGLGQLFPWHLLHAVRVLKDPVTPPSRPQYRLTTMGVDVANSLKGDHSCVFVVRHGKVIFYERWREPDLMLNAEKIASLILRFAPQRIRVDVGGPGGGLKDRLKQKGFPVEPIHFGGSAVKSESYQNWRAEAYHTLRRRLEEHSLALPDDDELLAELAAVTVVDRTSGKLQLISKAEIRAKINRSPDYADALALAVCEGDPNFAFASSVTLSVGPATFRSLPPASQRRNADGLPPSGDPAIRQQREWFARQGRQAS